MDKKKEIESINKCIQDLVYEKVELKKAYNYYHCIRDAEQFRHIEDNYGIGVPTSIGFTPLIKKHIDVLVGEYLELDPDLQITCKDEKTVSNIMRDKQLEINKQVYNLLKSKLQNVIIQVFVDGKQAANDPFIEKEIEKLKKDIDKNYVSEYERAAQNILNYVKHSRDLDLKNKMRELFTDLLISGICYYRTKPSGSGENLKLEILNPLDTFIERNRNEFYLNKSPRSVIRRWMTEEQIRYEFNDELSPEAKAILKDYASKGERNYNTVYIRQPRSIEGEDNQYQATRVVPSPGILGGLEVTPVFPWNETGMYNYNNNPVIPVYECEWIVWDKDKKRVTKHEGVKIGEEIFITRGESKYICRSQSNPKECSLSINGMFFSDKNGQPFSLMLNTMDLQDKLDLLIYYRDNLIATSGTVGDWIDIAHIPSALGVELPEKLAKWKAYKKNGVAIIDSSEEGIPLNTTFNGFDDTVKAQSIQAIQIAIDAVEQQACQITGVFPEKLGGIQQRDAVSNVKVGIRQSTILTKQYFYAMDLMYKEINYDLLNLAKFVYKHGLTGTIILGNKVKQIFTALPEYYTITDFDIHIQDSSEMFRVRETLNQLSIEFVKSGQADPAMIINTMMAKNMTEMKDYLEEALEEKKQENNAIQQLQQQVQQLDQQNKQLNQQLQQAQSENKRLNSQIQQNNNLKWDIEKKKVALQEQEIRDKRENDKKLTDLKEKELEVELSQLHDGNPYNDKIRNS